MKTRKRITLLQKVGGKENKEANLHMYICCM